MCASAFVQLINILKCHFPAMSCSYVHNFQTGKTLFTSELRKKNITSWVIFVLSISVACTLYLCFFGSAVRFQQNDTDLHIDLHVILLLVPLKKETKKKKKMQAKWRWDRWMKRISNGQANGMMHVLYRSNIIKSSYAFSIFRWKEFCKRQKVPF